MLKNIPPILSPRLLCILAEMGHGDEIVLADGNFPAESMGKNCVVIRADGHGVIPLLQAVLTLMPLDTYVECPVALMKVLPSDEQNPAIWEKYRHVLNCHHKPPPEIEMMDRIDFYERSRNAYAIVATGESAIYANILLKKGVVK